MRANGKSWAGTRPMQSKCFGNKMRRQRKWLGTEKYHVQASLDTSELSSYG